MSVAHGGSVAIACRNWKKNMTATTRTVRVRARAECHIHQRGGGSGASFVQNELWDSFWSVLTNAYNNILTAPVVVLCIFGRGKKCGRARKFKKKVCAFITCSSCLDLQIISTFFLQAIAVRCINADEVLVYDDNNQCGNYEIVGCENRAARRGANIDVCVCTVHSVSSLIAA